MGWQVEQNTGINGQVIRFVWFHGYIYAGSEDDGVWRRDGIGPWVRVFNGPISSGGTLWHWEDDDALYCGDVWNIYRSTDGVTWVLDQNLNLLGSGQGSFSSYSMIGGYGDYLYVANHDVGGAGATYFYRRDLAGTWANYAAPHVGTEGVWGRGIIGFGGEVYWTNATRARYWDGAAWSPEPTLDGNVGSSCYMSLINHELYIGSSSSIDLNRRYYWKTAPATNWSQLNLTVPSNAWSTWTLSEGADGEVYTATANGVNIAIYRKTNNHMALVGYGTPAVGPDGRGGVSVDTVGDMYFGTRAGGTIRFFAFVPDYDLTPDGDGLLPQAMDVGGDGNVLYLGLYDGAGNPVLIRVNLPLTAASMGNLMYDPGAGDAINVKCTNVGRNLVISGYFGANEQVRYSDDGGVTLTDMDPNTWAANRAQPLLVDPDTTAEVMVALDAAQDLYETEDQGVLWTQRNAAIGYTPSAAARLPDGPELVIGDGAANRIDYSPYHGVVLHDITAGFIGFCQALEVV